MTPKQALEFIGGLGKPSKMPCFSYSISAFKCQIGRRLAELKNSVCNKCYAVRGNYLFEVVKDAHQKRLESMAKPEWVDNAVVAINYYEKSGHFRWFDSGDLQDLKMLEKIATVAKRLPHIKFWLPTKQYNYVRQYLAQHGQFPQNLTVRISGYLLEQKPHLFAGVVGSSVSKVSYTCPSSSQGNKCLDCRLCWDKKTPIVTYKYH